MGNRQGWWIALDMHTRALPRLVGTNKLIKHDDKTRRSESTSSINAGGPPTPCTAPVCPTSSEHRADTMSRKNPFSFGAPGPDPQPVPPQTASQEVPGNPFGNPFATPPSVAAAAAVPPNLFADGGDDDDDPFAPPKAAAAARPSPRNDHVTQVSPTRSPAPPRRAAGPTPAPGHVDITPKRAAAAITAAVTVPQLPAAAPPPPPSFTDHIDHAEAVLQRDALARTIALMRSSAPVTGGGGDIPSDAVTTAVAGGPLLLERFRSARQKEQLLDAATASLHGDIIKLAGRFVLSTMAPTLAAKVFVARPVACQHMIQWFRTRHEWAEVQ